MRLRRALLAACAAAVAAAVPASAQGTSGAARIDGVHGSSLPIVTSADVAPDGTTAVAGTVSAGTGRRVVAGFGVGGVPASLSARGTAGDVLSQPQAAAGRRGAGAVVWSLGRRVLLSLCSGGRCAAAVEVGRSQLDPLAQVAVDPETGRALVLWRGSASGRNRLQWRVTTGGRLGPVHTLAEFGDTPRIGTDASGKTIAVWIGASGVRTAARRVGEFTRPTTIGPAGAQSLDLAVASSGDTVAAWRANGGDAQSPRGTPVTISRGRDTAFGPVQPLTGVTNAGTLSVAVAPGGRAVLAFTAQVDDATATVTAAYRSGRGLPFGAPAAVAPPQFVSTAWGASAAIDAQGRATVAWGGAGSASAARSDASGAFAPAQALAPTPGGASIRVLAAAGGATTLVSWLDTSGAWGALGM